VIYISFLQKAYKQYSKNKAMTQLIACLSTGKGTWSHVSRLINEEAWDKVFLITNSFGKENFTSAEKPVEFMEIDQNKPLIELRDDIKTHLKDKLDGDVAVNLISGTGKEHMAIISALLQLGVGIRLIAHTKEGIKEI